jgi:hypothetical protein
VADGPHLAGAVGHARLVLGRVDREVPGVVAERAPCRRTGGEEQGRGARLCTRPRASSPAASGRQPGRTPGTRRGRAARGTCRALPGRPPGGMQPVLLLLLL